VEYDHDETVEVMERKTAGFEWSSFSCVELHLMYFFEMLR
jgi:hypothetical protein